MAKKKKKRQTVRKRRGGSVRRAPREEAQLPPLGSPERIRLAHEALAKRFVAERTSEELDTWAEIQGRSAGFDRGRESCVGGTRSSGAWRAALQTDPLPTDPKNVDPGARISRIVLEANARVRESFMRGFRSGVTDGWAFAKETGQCPSGLTRLRGTGSIIGPKKTRNLAGARSAPLAAGKQHAADQTGRSHCVYGPDNSLVRCFSKMETAREVARGFGSGFYAERKRK